MEKLIQRLTNETWEKINLNTMKAAKKVLIDTLGAMITGVNEPSMKNLIDVQVNIGDYLDFSQ